MEEDLRYKEIEKSITTTYRKKIWKKFVKAINDYDMIQEGDKIIVSSDGKSSKQDGKNNKKPPMRIIHFALERRLKSQ